MTDDIWGETDDIHNREWTKMDDGFTNAGYREGITAGKENSLQEGFDEGFAIVGAPLGQEIGKLRGITSACLSLSKSIQEHSVMMDCKDILRGLDNLHFKDLAPSDVEAEEHLKEHLQSQDDTQNIPALLEIRDEEKHKLAVETLKELRNRLQDVLRQIGLPITVV
ncbi:hypothetical protein Clacol_010016 [Clathrus columnatus]|uniref:Protein YAE1 n=1 Tax=Clathrus columnatus TaxID=1419009 RepID=A0AAV5AQG9_9AGAM|nr:hypothetical protein Clacol_010016 [Clathrus columnatus]